MRKLDLLDLIKYGSRRGAAGGGCSEWWVEAGSVLWVLN